MRERSSAEVQAEAKTEEIRQFVRGVRRATRRKFTFEDKVRTALEAFRGKARVSKLCRREAIWGSPGGPGGIRTHDSRTRSPGSFR